MHVSHRTLKVLAALTWYGGGAMMLFKAFGYLSDAAASGPTSPALAAAGLGVTGGLLRGRTMFLRACRRNLRRIEGLHRPRPWQFFRPGFFAALAVMIAAGAALSRVGSSGYWAGLTVGGLELVIALGLLTSSVAFWSGSQPEPASSPSTVAGDEISA